MTCFRDTQYDKAAEYAAHRGSPALIAELIRLFQSADPETFREDEFRSRVDLHKLSVSTGACLVLPKWSRGMWGAD